MVRKVAVAIGAVSALVSIALTPTTASASTANPAVAPLKWVGLLGFEMGDGKLANCTATEFC